MVQRTKTASRAQKHFTKISARDKPLSSIVLYLCSQPSLPSSCFVPPSSSFVVLVCHAVHQSKLRRFVEELGVASYKEDEASSIYELDTPPGVSRLEIGVGAKSRTSEELQFCSSRFPHGQRGHEFTESYRFAASCEPLRTGATRGQLPVSAVVPFNTVSEKGCWTTSIKVGS